MEVEVLALVAGLEFCLNHGWLDVLVESDSQLLYQILLGSNAISWRLDALIRNAKDLFDL
ncbi:hypothetical protein ACH5RR_037239, partial [Cinchona calisaya]